MKAIVVIDNIKEEWFKDNLSCKFQLLYYPNGEMKELGISGKHHLKPLPQKKYAGCDLPEWKEYKNKGWNDCIDEILKEVEE